ncbi:MAG: type IV secretory system conjugative DNA transfer family protein [Oscillospiraceae bacterium]|jgi:type IV secretion system protein VirD4|nr:type IV secretory system conjugative DNA transfer family protein [Oscillospiraceae bacterium]
MNKVRSSAILKRRVLPDLLYLAVFWLCCKLGQSFRLSPGENAVVRTIHAASMLSVVLRTPFSGLARTDFVVGLLGTAVLYAIVLARRQAAKKYRNGIEHGSARWGKSSDIAPFVDAKPENNIILTQTESLTMNPRPKNVKFARNKNMLVIGGSGSGKTRFVLKPNLMQCRSADYPVSFVVTDPKGELLRDCGTMLRQNGYRIKVLNTVDFGRSHRYNPMAYIHSEKDILKLVGTLMTNTKSEQKGGDPFWEKAETLLFTALIAYLQYFAPQEERNFATLTEMLSAMEVREEDEAYKNVVDQMFDALEERYGEHFAVRQYRKFKLAAGVVCSERLIYQH